jgi:hypothetical protein
MGLKWVQGIGLRDVMTTITKQDKYVLERWLQLYNRLSQTSYTVESWPDDDSSKEQIDAVCIDGSAEKLAIEHTLIQSFVGEKKDTDRFSKTLAKLENHPDLIVPGYSFTVAQRVGAIQSGTDWKEIETELPRQLEGILPNLPEGQITVRVGTEKWQLELQIVKSPSVPDLGDRCWVARLWPGDPGPELIIEAIERKIPKLAKYVVFKKILLLEQDGVAGTIEAQFEKLSQADQGIAEILDAIDEIWSVNTSFLESEQTIYSNQVWPNFRMLRCGLDFRTGRFWRGPV